MHWTTAQKRRFRAKLRSWFRTAQRPMPWRANRDPYRIWVSEVMLQQTTVAAVGPYFERFMAAFPTLADLATAKESDVFRLWQGLGYYRRARHLHQAAQILFQHDPQTLPDDPALWAELPGVGRYILGAVLS
ncbi:MAG: A/G-specific adenine glycosylase, partial [Gemmataceae bacterium]